MIEVMKRLLGIISAFYLYSSLAVYSFAQQITVTDPAGISGTSTQEVLQFIINLFFVIGVIFALTFLIWGGVRWIFSRGNKEKIEEARQHLIASIVGLIFVVGAFVFINIALRLLTGQDIGDFLTLPKLGD